MSNNKTKRILVPGDDLNHEAIGSAIAIGIELSEKNSSEVDGVVIFIPSKGQIRHTSLEAVLGEKIASALHKGNGVNLHSNISLRAETIQTFKRSFKRDIVIAVYADQKMMDQLDGMPNLHTIIAVPHLPDALIGWVKTWSPIIFGEQPGKVENIINDAIIESALSSLTNSINLSHTILNPRDKEHTDNTIRILRRNKHTEDSSNIRAWAVKNGWHPKAADELEKLWLKIFNLNKTPKVKDSVQAKRSYEYWIEKSENANRVAGGV